MTLQEKVEAIGHIWPRCRVHTQEGRVYAINISGDTITYEGLLQLSAILGTTRIDIEHESGGSYSEVTPDLRPGNFSIWIGV